MIGGSSDPRSVWFYEPKRLAYGEEHRGLQKKEQF